MITRKRSAKSAKSAKSANLKYIKVDKSKVDKKLLDKIIKTHDQIFFNHYDRYDREFWKLLIDKSQYIELVYGPRSKLIGYILTLDKIQDVIPSNKEKFKNVLSYIALLGVNTKNRNIGIGHNLLENLSKYLTKKITKTKYNIILDVILDNENSVNFYEKNGYSIYKKKTIQLENESIHQYIMKKKLIKGLEIKSKKVNK